MAEAGGRFTESVGLKLAVVVAVGRAHWRRQQTTEDKPLIATLEEHLSFASAQTPAQTKTKVREAFGRKKAITLFLAEEQQILKEAYQAFFSAQPGLELVGSSEDTSPEFLVQATRALQPQVMLLGVRKVERSTAETLELLREASPEMAPVLLFAFYDVQGIKALREFSKASSSGCAYLLKHTIDTVEQLTQVIYSVAQGRIIVDPMVMESLIKTGDATSSFLNELSPRELEVLSWMAKGYRNDTIADVLSRDVKTIERHINNIYSKLHNDRSEDTDSSRHPRVNATLTYLRATGLLPSDPGFED